MDSPTELIAKPDAVMLDLVADSREGAIRELHARLAKSAGVDDAPLLLHDLLERVMLAPVCIADDVALPHARTAAVNRITLGVARVADPGVGFDAEHPHVRLIFLVGTPKPQVEEYLQMVSAISRLLRAEGARAGLFAARTEAEFRAQLTRGAKQ